MKVEQLFFENTIKLSMQNTHFEKKIQKIYRMQFTSQAIFFGIKVGIS